ncbi:MAG TPA: site-2 protease family protein [Coleofasciculaceae cyanobacterium]|jgi:Zn-dependent protease/CBS domain-containing protein
MFRRGIPLFNMFGFKVRLDASWFFLALLITWTLATGFFPFTYPGLSYGGYLWMGLSVAVGLFFSIIVHEFAHSWVARRFGMPMGGITLFLFGGVAEMEHEATSPKMEFWMALAGPATSVLVMLLFGGVTLLGLRAGWPTPVTGVTSYLSTLNGILAVFNMVPAFPLDGGRVLRSALWQWKKNLQWATRITSNLGSWFGVFLIVMGILRMLEGAFIGGLWSVLIGLFLRGAAGASYRQLIMQRELEGEPVRRFMQTEVITVPPSLPLPELINSHFYRSYHKRYPVTQEGRLAGYVDLDQVRRTPQQEWAYLQVGDIATPANPESTIEADADAMSALKRLSRDGGAEPLMVVQNNQLVGLLSLQDLQRFLSMKMKLEGEPG